MLKISLQSKRILTSVFMKKEFDRSSPTYKLSKGLKRMAIWSTTLVLGYMVYLGWIGHTDGQVGNYGTHISQEVEFESLLSARIPLVRSNSYVIKCFFEPSNLFLPLIPPDSSHQTFLL